MTIDEAIKELKDASDSEVRYGDTDHHYDEVMKRIEAFDLAIKALEQQNKSETPTGSDPCDGCRYELNSTNGNPCYSCGKYKLTEKQPCKDYLKKRDGNYVHYNVEWLLKNWQMELDILSDGKIKPCDDVINREDLLKEVNEYASLWTSYTLNMSKHKIAERAMDDAKQGLIRMINDMPSVQPTRPEGKWIQTKDDCDGVNFYDFSFKCSKCGKEQSFKSNYCFNCGADMKESDTDDDR